MDPPGQNRGKVTSFLLSSLRGTGAVKYTDAIDSFKAELLARNIDFDDLTEEEIDWILAEKVVDLFEDGDSGAHGLGQAATLISALQKVNPRHKYKVSWRALDVWRFRCPPQQAPAFPPELAMACVVWLLLAGQPEVATAVLLCFTCLLRASESLRLLWKDVIMSARMLTLCLGETKRGMEQKVQNTNAGVLKWMCRYMSTRLFSLEDRVCPVSYTTMARWLQKACDSLGFGSVHWTSHGLRRGGASELLRQGVPLSLFLMASRWLSERSAREYLRKGEVSVLRLRGLIPKASWLKAHKMASLGDTAWDICDESANVSKRIKQQSTATDMLPF